MAFVTIRCKTARRGLLVKMSANRSSIEIFWIFAHFVHVKIVSLSCAKDEGWGQTVDLIRELNE